MLDSLSQTLLIRASVIRMPHNPNTVPGNLFYQVSIYNDSVIHMIHNPNTFEWVPNCSDKRGLTLYLQTECFGKGPITLCAYLGRFEGVVGGEVDV